MVERPRGDIPPGLLTRDRAHRAAEAALGPCSLPAASCISKIGAQRSFLARPKMYEFRLPTLLTGIASFQDPYLISGWFMGSQWTRKGNARLPPSLIYARIPLGVPGSEISGPMEAIRFEDCLNDCKAPPFDVSGIAKHGSEQLVDL
jgi:hypothetical protein